MVASVGGPGASSKLFLFGSQTLNFNQESLQELCAQLQEDVGLQWARDTLLDLPSAWDTVSLNVQKLQAYKGRELLEQLEHGLRTRDLSQVIFPLKNVRAIPLAIASQLAQYSNFVKAALPELTDTEELPPSVKSSTQVLGLCTGTLAAFAVACSSSLVELKHYGAVAIRLAMIIGALGDAEEAAPRSGGDAVLFSASWNTAEVGAKMVEIMERFPESYPSVYFDEKRLTLTTAKSSSAALVDELKQAGVRVTELGGLCGRFHQQSHREEVEQVVQLCDNDDAFRLPDASKTFFPARSSIDGEHVTSGKLHELGLRAVLLERPEWFKAFCLVYSAHLTASNATVISFGERSAPPTFTRKLGTKLVDVNGLDLSASPIPLSLLGPSQTELLASLPDERIAVIGMALHVAGAEDVDQYWKILARGQSQHREIPPERFSMETTWRQPDPNRKWFGNFIDNYDVFDHKFFKKSPREMTSTDPQHRLILQHAYQAVEQSGYFGNSGFDKHIGCFIGVGNCDYEHNIACYPANAYCATGNLKTFLPGKVSHYFGWTGPSLTLDTACSSSTVAIHLACRAILNGECTSALAGGVNTITHAEWYHNLAGASFLSPSGQCKPFDAKADGYCRGEGAGVVFLKKLTSALADGDQVLGVISGTRVHQNQNYTAITVPNAPSLAGLFKDVVRRSRLGPQDVSVVEAHGTGTPVGDPNEFDGIRRVFGGSLRPDTVALGSVKGLIGHTECASGVASLVKIILMLNKGLIPPQASFSAINPALKMRPEDGIEIPTRIKPWDAGFRAALINNYGASGSNASMVVTEAPKLDSQEQMSRSLTNKSFPFWFCGFDVPSLRANVARFLKYLEEQRQASLPELSVANLSFQVAHQSNRGLTQSFICSATSVEELASKLRAYQQNDKSAGAAIQQPSLSRPVILAFGPQVSTYVGLDRSVYENITILRKYLDECNDACLALGLASIYPDIFQRSPVQDTVKLQTVLFAMQYSCAKAWIDSGIKPVAFVGHSFGELTVLSVSGVLSLRDAVKMISGRARLIRDKWGSEKGAMLAVEGDLTSVEGLLTRANEEFQGEAAISIACYNGPTTFTIAGPAGGVQLLQDLAKDTSPYSSLKLKKLNVTNAFHSALVEPLLDDLGALLRDLSFHEPTIQVEHATEQSFTSKPDSNLVANHLRKPVFFNHAVQRLAKQHPAALWLEAGSNSTITTMISRSLSAAGSPHHFQPVNVTTDDSFNALTEVFTKLWKEGVNVRFWAHHPIQTGDYTPLILPPYQFEKVRHWLDLKKPQKYEAPAPVEQRPQEPEVPMGLTTFIGYQDQARRSVRFKINTTIEKFKILVSAHIMANTAAVMTGVFQMEIVSGAFLSLLQQSSHDMSYQPELRGIEFYNPLVVTDDSKLVWLDGSARDDEGLVWDWKLMSMETAGVSTHHSSGTIILQSATDPSVKDDFERLVRLSGRNRCVRLLEGTNADDVLVGRNIYRAFYEVIDYRELYRHVTKVVGKDNESAGRVERAHNKDGWIDSILTDCFAQTAGIFVNLMTDKSDLSERGIFICDGIERMIRAPGRSVDSLPAMWEVFAVHHRASEDKYISDVFAFDARDGSLVEMMLGMSYQRVAMAGIRKALSRLVPSDTSSRAVVPPPIQKSTATTPTLSSAFTSAKTALSAPAVAIGTPLSQPITAPLPPQTAAVAAEKAKEKKKRAKTSSQKPKSAGPDIAAKTREILCNLSGLEPEEIKGDSDLVELGIDSLMSMELTREVHAALNCTLENEHLMSLTDFNSLVVCIATTLGVDGQEPALDTLENGVEDEEEAEEEERSEPTMKGQVNGVNGTPNGVNGLNHVNGATYAVDTILPESAVLDAFREAKKATDDFIVKGHLGTYYDEIIPRSTELCVVHILDAFEQLGCPIRSAAPGQQLDRVPYLPKHQKFMDLIYDLLCNNARLIDIDASGRITRTAVPIPSESAETLLEGLLRDEPIHSAEHKLTSLTGSRFADCLTGKEDGLQLIFGTAEGREVVSDVYAKSPINSMWIEQAEYFLERLIGRLHSISEENPLRILEMGAGTGGTTCKIVPLLARLGVPVVFTMTDLSPSLMAAGRKRFSKQYPFMQFKVLDIESEPKPELLQSQHMILATNCVHATRNLTISTDNIRRILRPDGFLLLLEMTERVPWVDFIFGLLEGWWLFEDGRKHALSTAPYWEQILHSVGFGHVDWTDGDRPEANIQRLIIAHTSGPRYAKASVSKRLCGENEGPLTDVADRQATIDGYVRQYTKDFHMPSESSIQYHLSSSAPTGHCVLVTGATGSLGSHIVASVAQLPNVRAVWCLNRPQSGVDAAVRQQKALDLREIALDPVSKSKLKVIETDASKPLLGLSPEAYQSLVLGVTHIVHNAWPMSLTRPVRGYEPQFKTMRNLIHLASEASVGRSTSSIFGFQFISSIGVVGYYPIWTGSALAPEQPMTANGVLPVGYADAKLVCERMLDQTLHRHPTRFHAMSVRIAQITGSRTGNGFWNPVEHFPFLVKSSQMLNKLPDLRGTLSWCPVDDVAAALRELLFPDRHDNGDEGRGQVIARPHPIYHIENPSRQPWDEMIITLAEVLDVPNTNIVPFQEWVDHVRQFKGSASDNPAGQIVDFFDEHFIRMSCGGLVLDTVRSRERSKTLRTRGPVEAELVLKYIAAWKESGFLK